MTDVPTCALPGCDNPVPDRNGGRLCCCAAHSTELNRQRNTLRKRQLRIDRRAAKLPLPPVPDDGIRRCRVCLKPLIQRRNEHETRFAGRKCCSHVCANRLHAERYRAPPETSATATDDESGRRVPVVPFRINPVVILPLRPASVRRYYDTKRPTPFQDDLNAIADHGSPGRPIRDAAYSPSRSTLA